MKKLLCLLFVSFLLCSCDRLFDSDDSKSGYLDYLPEKTQVGANTFGCYINGELAASQGWYQNEGVEPSKMGSGLRYVNGYWGKYIRTFNQEQADTVMQLQIGLKELRLLIKYYFLQRGSYDSEVYIQFRDNPDLSGSVVTTIDITKFDPLNHIISGEFKAVDIPLYRIDSVIHLRKGRFDIKYGTNF